MSKSILIHENGGPEKMQLADGEVGSPGPGQVKIRHTAIGLNFIDVYYRTGLYPVPLPSGLGGEGAGVVLLRLRAALQILHLGGDAQGAVLPLVALGDDGVQRGQVVARMRIQAMLGVGFGLIGVQLGEIFVVKGLVAHLSFPSSIRPSTRAV